jgi:hypothetical protein
MKLVTTNLASATLFLATLFAAGTALGQHDCPGNFQTLPNYHRGMGQPCKILGLDSRHGTCRPGDTYETLCDDADGGRYKTCQGPRLCNEQRYPEPGRREDCSRWDFVNNQPCPRGYVNLDCSGYCEPATSGDDNCKFWDFAYNRPCPEGYINYDCQGGCEPASRHGR